MRSPNSLRSKPRTEYSMWWREPVLYKSVRFRLQSTASGPGGPIMRCNQNRESPRKAIWRIEPESWWHSAIMWTLMPSCPLALPLPTTPTFVFNPPYASYRHTAFCRTMFISRCPRSILTVALWDFNKELAKKLCLWDHRPGALENGVLQKPLCLQPALPYITIELDPPLNKVLTRSRVDRVQRIENSDWFGKCSGLGWVVSGKKVTQSTLDPVKNMSR